jgi:hypothetical protein
MQRPAGKHDDLARLSRALAGAALLHAVVVDALTERGRAPASAGPRRLAPLRARPTLGVSLGEQQNHYCDTEQDKTDRAHGFFLPVRPFVRRPRYKTLISWFSSATSSSGRNIKAFEDLPSLLNDHSLAPLCA